VWDFFFVLIIVIGFSFISEGFLVNGAVKDQLKLGFMPS
jgi:hypothetical protein